MKHVLWHNDDHTVILFDGPQSIADAQGSGLASAGFRVLSSTPLVEPFPSQEPKSADARDRLLQTTGVSEASRAYAQVLQHALEEVKRSYDGAWHIARNVEDSKSKQSDIDVAFAAAMASTSVEKMTLASRCTMAYNEHQSLGLLQDDAMQYLLPAQSTAFNMDCNSRKHVGEFHAAIRSQASEHETPWKFDVMVVDPPWTNSSVKRKRKLYQTSEDIEMWDMLLRLDLDRLMAPDCMICVWITNKTSAREAILGEGGLFDTCGVDLLEEWIWLKVTSKGEPIRGIESLWSRPYEVLLVGRRRCTYEPLPAQESPVRQRILIGVPDIHSRKPCLEHLLRTILKFENGYRGLEVFARHLVAGWWSIGNECVKYNDATLWRKP